MTSLRSGFPLFLVLLAGLPLSADAGSPRQPTACGGETPHAYVSVNVTATDACDAYVPSLIGGQYAVVYVLVNSVPFRKVRFTLPDPSFGTVVGEGWYFPYTGTRTTGIELSVGCPGEGITTVGELFVFIPSGSITGCPAWAPANGCETEDCNGVVHAAEAWNVYFRSDLYFCSQCFQQCQGLPPYDLFPPDGATNVPLNVQLSWAGPPHVDPYSVVSCSVAISTDPDCQTVQVYTAACDTKTFSPDFLQPATTYYWHASYGYTGSGCSSGNGGVSSTYSFTTASIVAAQPMTWGRVKAIYRE